MVGKGSHWKELIEVWMQTAAAHHRWPIKAILLFTALTEDALRFPWHILTVKSSESFSQMSEEEFGIQSAGPIILPCDSVFMDYVISFIQRGIAKDLERALIMSIASSNCSSSSYFPQEQNNEQLLLCAF